MEWNESDSELARRAAAGDRTAVEDMAERLRCVRGIVAALNARLPRPLSDDEVSETVQNALVAIWSKLHGYTGRVSVQSWAYGFCRIEILTTLRGRSRAARTVPLEEEPRSASEANPSEDVEPVLRALERVDPRRAEVIRMKHFDALTFEEIALRLGIPANTAKTLYYRGLENVQQLLKQAFAREAR